MADQIRKLRVELGASGGQFQSVFKKSADSVGGLGKSLDKLEGTVKGAFDSMAGSAGQLGGVLSALGPAGLVAAAGIGALSVAVGGVVAFIAEATKGLVEFGGKLADLSERTGLSTTTLQELKFAGSLVGVSMEEAADGMNKLQKAIVAGDSVFERLGLNLDRLRGLDAAGQFDAVATAIRGISDPAQQAAAAMEAFGKGGVTLLPLIKSDMAAAREEAHRLGIVIGDETVAAADQLGDSATKLSAAWDGFKNQLAGTIVDSGALQGALDELLVVAANLTKLVTDNRGVISALFEGAEGAATTTLTLLKNIAEVIEKLPGAGLVKGFGGGIGATIAQINAAQESRRQASEGAKAAAGVGGKIGRSFVSQEDIDKAGKLAAQFEKLAEAERKAFIESNKLAAAEDAAVEKINAAVKKRLSDASVTIFGTSKQAAVEAEFQFDLLKKVIADAKKTIGDLTVNELVAYEQKLNEIEKATRADAEANAAVRKEREAVRKIIDETDAAAHMDEATKRTEETTKATIDWRKELESISALIQSFPGGLGKVGGVLSGLTAGISGIGSGIDAFKKAQAAGGLSGILGKLGAAGQIASAAIGIGSAIVGLFKSDPVKKAQKEAGRALGHGISREMAETFLDEAKRTGKSITQVAKEWQRRVKAEQDAANLDTLRTGVAVAQQGAEALLGLMDKLSPKAQAAGGALVKAVADAMAANGLGFLATGELAKSEQFNAVQQAVAAAGQVVGGLRQAGGISTEFLGQGAAFAEALKQQAIEAALAAGKTQEEAQKIGIATIAPLLRDQLNASIESGQELDANTRALLEEAKANGIEIVADPMIAMLAESKQQTGLLRKIAGEPAPDAGSVRDAFEGWVGTPSRGPLPSFIDGGIGDFGSGMDVRLHGLEAIVPLGSRGSAAFGGITIPSVVVNVTGAPNMSPAEFQNRVEAAVAQGIRLGSPALTREFDRKFSRP